MIKQVAILWHKTTQFATPATNPTGRHRRQLKEMKKGLKAILALRRKAF